VERLLELGFDPNVPGKNNDLVLIMALQNQKLDIVSCLLNHGADPNKTGGRDDHPKVSQLGLNSAHWVSFYGDVNSLSQISKVPVNWNQRARPVKLIAKNGYVYTVNPHCLHLATTVGKPPHVLRFLIDLCSDDINCTTSEGYTPLHIAAFMGNLPCAKVLVERGGNIHQRDVHGNVPLHYAVQTNSESLVEYLIQCGTPLTVNNDGISPSVLASLYNQTNILEIFKRNETRGCMYAPDDDIRFEFHNCFIFLMK
jgi:ankyrin repeat protein